MEASHHVPSNGGPVSPTMIEKLDTETWTQVLSSAFEILDDLASQGFGTAPFVLGGGTVLMLRFSHRLSNDINLFTYDARWLALVTPRLNPTAQALARDYDEQANVVKIVMRHGDIDFIVSGQVTANAGGQTIQAIGRTIEVDTTAEILAKKAFYRASSFKPRDVYDMSAAIDLDPSSAAEAIRAAAPKAPLLLRRLDAMKSLDERSLVAEIVPYGTSLPHAKGMVAKVANFVSREIEDKNLSGIPSAPRRTASVPRPTRPTSAKRSKPTSGWER